MNRIQCFYLVQTDLDKVYLRRYSGEHGVCPVHGYHNAMNWIGDFYKSVKVEKPESSDDRWPTQCDCGYEFANNDVWQVFARSLYERVDNGQRMTIEDAPVGAMWNAEWLADFKHFTGPDGCSMHVKTPGGEWCIDGRASNCTRPEDNVHKCWVRHGEPPNITVDKNGDTCAAGAGSIIVGNYHGFLRGGFLESC